MRFRNENQTRKHSLLFPEMPADSSTKSTKTTCHASERKAQLSGRAMRERDTYGGWRDAQQSNCLRVQVSTYSWLPEQADKHLLRAPEPSTPFSSHQRLILSCSPSPPLRPCKRPQNPVQDPSSLLYIHQKLTASPATNKAIPTQIDCHRRRTHTHRPVEQ
jgi:hypothetical protein